MSVSLRFFFCCLEQAYAIGCNYFGALETLLVKCLHKKKLLRYGSDRLKVVYETTEFSLYRIKTADSKEDISAFKHLFDLSEDPKSHFLHHKTNKRVPLTMTDEPNRKGLRIVCLRSKLFGIDFLGGA